MSYRDEIVNYVRTHIDAQFEPDGDLLIQALDSVSLLQLVAFIDQELGVELELSTLTLDAFATVDSVLQTIAAFEVAPEPSSCSSAH